MLSSRVNDHYVCSLTKHQCKIFDCVVPENIQTPTTEEISLRTPPPPWIFHFCRELMAPPPLRNFHKCDKDPPTPLEKFIFMKKDY